MDFGEIINKEKDMLLTAEEKYGNHFINSFRFITLMQEFIMEVKPDAWVFALFLSQVRKHLVLSFFSALRQHHNQAMLDLRQVYEAGTKGGYAIAFPDVSKFVQTDDRGISFEPKGLTNECYKWLEEKYPECTLPLKRLKRSINESCAHANAIYAFQNFKIAKETKKFEFSFFDKDDIDLVKGDLWFIGNTSMGFMDLFFGINKNRNLIVFSPDFVSKLKDYENFGNELKSELMSKERFSRFKDF